MKFRLIILSVILLGAAVILSLPGCGNPTGGGGGGGGTGTNRGTVSGQVFCSNNTRGTYSGVSGVTVFVSTEAMSLEVSATTDADGKYTLRGLPPGPVPVTVIIDNYTARTVVANSDTFNFVIDYVNEPGSATIRGTLEGLPEDATADNVSIYCAALSGKYFDYSWFYDETTHTYEVSGAPDDGTVYIRARYYYCDYYTEIIQRAYNRVNTSRDGIFDCKISFEPIACITGEVINMPDGYDFDGASAGISNGRQYIASAKGYYSQISPSDFILYGLSPLKSGDSYRISVYGYKSDNNDWFAKYFYGRTAGDGQQFDMSISMPYLPASLIKHISDGDTLSGTPTFEWHAVPGATYYAVYFDYYDPITYVDYYWTGITYDTKISIPQKVFDNYPPGADCYLDVYAYNVSNYHPIYSPEKATNSAYLNYSVGAYRNVTIGGEL